MGRRAAHYARRARAQHPRPDRVPAVFGAIAKSRYAPHDDRSLVACARSGDDGAAAGRAAQDGDPRP